MAALIAEIIHNEPIAPKILEIGPGNGLTSLLLKYQNFLVEAMDTDHQTCKQLTQNFGYTSWSGQFEHSNFPPKYNFIYAGHVIEHSEDPMKFFRKAWSSLQTDGLFFFDTPDAGYVPKRGLGWKHFNTRDPHEHCCLFTMRTVKYLAGKTNFKVVSTETLPEFESMQILLRKK